MYENIETNAMTLSSNIKDITFKKRNFNLIYNENIYKAYIEEINNDYTIYKPFDIPDLYEQFSKLNISDIKEMQNFINKYGNIGVYEDNKRPINEKYIEKCSDWRSKILEMKLCILALYIYNSENIGYTIKAKENELKFYKNSFLYKSWFDEYKTFFENQCSTNNDIANQLKMACLSDIQNAFRSNIGKIKFSPMIDVNKNDSYNPILKANIEFPSLLAIMYWQLYLKFIENKKHFVCEGCNQTLDWYNNKENFFCTSCYDKHKYKKSMENNKVKAHRKFMNKSGYYTGNNNVSCLYIDPESRKKLIALRERIKDESLENQRFMIESEYLKWIEKKDKYFMSKVENIKRGNKNGK